MRNVFLYKKILFKTWTLDWLIEILLLILGADKNFTVASVYPTSLADLT